MLNECGFLESCPSIYMLHHKHMEIYHKIKWQLMAFVSHDSAPFNYDVTSLI